MRRGKRAGTGASQATTSSRVIKSTNIRTWVHSHTEEETLELISSGHVIHFEEENLKTSDAMVMTVLQTAYIFFEAERERRSDRAIEAYYRRVEAGVYIPIPCWATTQVPSLPTIRRSQSGQCTERC